MKSYQDDSKVRDLIVACVVDKENTTAYSFRNGILKFNNKRRDTESVSQF